jgi:CPA2 family monovalent cation:H+ antiporter-2
MVINTPKRGQRLFPGDVLFMIGTDDQLDQFKADMEAGRALVVEKKPVEVVLEHFKVTDDSVFANKNIREGEIREKIHGIVVGIENENGRVVNPDSSYVIQPGDTVWVVGDKLRLLSLQKSKQLV